MKELSLEQVQEVNGGEGSPGIISPNEGATAILALGAAGGPATLAFAIPIAIALFVVA